jgi:uncharacterized membrane protein
MITGARESRAMMRSVRFRLGGVWRRCSRPGMPPLTPAAGQTPAVGDAAGKLAGATTYIVRRARRAVQVGWHRLRRLIRRHGCYNRLSLQPGQEPFWRLEIVDGWFAFRRSGLRAIEEPLVQPSRESGADVFKAGALLVSIKPEACETEQGGKGDFTAKVTFDGVDFDGCAFGGAISTASQEASQVLDALGPIDACLAKLGQPALVTAVYPRQDGEQIALGLRAKNGQVYECATDAAGSSVAYLDAIEQGSQPAWMSRMRFLREGTVTTAPCPDAEEVRSTDKVIGRLLTKACKF